jgi:hypothetical protein
MYCVICSSPDAARECHRQDAARIRSTYNQMRQTVCEGVRLAGSRSCCHEQRCSDVNAIRDAVFDSSTLDAAAEASMNQFPR